MAVPVWKPMPATPAPAPGARHETVIVGAGPVGLALALNLAQRGRPVVVLARFPFISAGSKAICFAKRTLDIFDGLGGIRDRVVEKGVRWNLGKVFHGASPEPIYTFDLTDAPGQKNPPFVNIQQYYVEDYLVDALAACPHAEIRWGHEVTGVHPDPDGVSVTVKTADTVYRLDAQYLVACDGYRSFVRRALGLEFQGRVFRDNFLIADVRIREKRLAERWFWFDPPWPGASALMHRQPDDIWRLDFQLGWDIDREEAVKPQNVDPFVRGMLGPDVSYDYEWLSVYTFECRRLARFVHGRVLFAGDAAHVVSPFGARGCNGGIADAENLGWKLDLVLRGLAGADLLASYNTEATAIADENILNSARATDFMTPKSPAAEAWRDAVLALARDHPFARPFVNSGRLSTAVHLPESPLNTPDAERWPDTTPAPGSPLTDAPQASGFLLESLPRDRFSLVAERPHAVDSLAHGIILDTDAARARCGLGTDGAVLVRPDGYVAARFRNPSSGQVAGALERALALPATGHSDTR